MAGDPSADGRFSRCYTLHPESPSGSSFLKEMSLPGAIVCESATKESAIAVGATIRQQLLNAFNFERKIHRDRHQGLADAFGLRYDPFLARYHDSNNHNNELGVIPLLIQGRVP